VKRQPRFVPYGSGPLSAQGRRALWTLVEPSLTDICQSLELGHFVRARRIERGSHHLVWRVHTGEGVYALRPCARTGREAATRHASRERLWTTVGQWEVAPRYRGSQRLHMNEFDGWIEAFDWIDGRPLRPAADHRPLARTLAWLHGRSPGGAKNTVPEVSLQPFLQTELRGYLRRNRDGGSVKPLLRSRTLAALSSLEDCGPSSVKPRLVHNDLVDGNVLSQRGRVWLIDWDWAMITSPVVDLFCFLSPFVRSWGGQPRFLTEKVAKGFLAAYSAERGKGHTARILRSDGAFWVPYNTLLANWLYHEPLGMPHTTNAAFYRRAFAEVERLGEVIAAFK